MLKLILKIHFLGSCWLISILSTVPSIVCWQLTCALWGFRYLFFVRLFLSPNPTVTY